MVVGSSCSESVSLLEDDEFKGGGCLGTRLYFVLLGRVSASISCKKDCNSCSASSSRVKEGLEDDL